MKKNNFFKNNLIISMIFGIIVAIFGIVILFQGVEFISFVILLYGLYSVYVGAKGLIFTSNIKDWKKTKNVNSFSSILSIIIGLIIIIYPYFASKLAVNIIVYLLAIQLLISGLNNLFRYVSLRNTDYFSSAFFINGVLNILIALIFFLFPSQVAQFFLRIVGVICIFYGLGHFLWSFRIRKVEKEFAKTNVEGEFEKVD